MGASESFEASFRSLILRMPYEKITVAEICRTAHLSRKTFYANFADKEAVVARIFVKGAIEPMRAMNNLLTYEQARSISSMYTENLYNYFANDAEYYKKLVGPMFGKDDTFIRVVTSELFAFNQEILSSISAAEDVEKEYIAYFFASSQAMYSQKWIADGMPVSPKKLAEIYNLIIGDSWFTIESAGRR
ncbi:TetR/AcrR family transcriptional regulator [Adlercreutzia sp. ZJ242]|uniref:TetR/AcrR family transcriptional regulator n=1 Tax=Adlercreutzia sp. ZJ242 TaxID=2709409 RepID=UPI0013ED1A0C|nr:TetR/AcrR family transcriptional regulator [Adlercreutzia sp. ZJ242]